MLRYGARSCIPVVSLWCVNCTLECMRVPSLEASHADHRERVHLGGLGADASRHRGGYGAWVREVDCFLAPPFRRTSRDEEKGAGVI
jgi:hypothetical protein